MKNIELSMRQSAVANSEAVLASAPYWEKDEAERVLDFNRRMLAGLEARLASN
jgi:hypothetical protein